jgi:two-component system, OmpR family, KDP operon response regulator KdpE
MGTGLVRNLQEICSQTLYFERDRLDNLQVGVPRAVTTAMHAVLIVEGNSDAQGELRSLFEANGFRVVVAETAVRGLRAARAQRPDVVVVNLKLRDMDGIRFVRELRTWSAVPLIVMSPAAAEAQRLEAFEQGADECIAKPFSAPEFLARVWAILRRCVRTQSAQTGLRIGSVSVNLIRRTARYVDGRELHFTPLEHRVLETLVRHADRVVMRRTLLRQVWGPNQYDSRSLRVCIRNLRRKLQEEPGSPHHLVTEVGLGYRLVTHVDT